MRSPTPVQLASAFYKNCRDAGKLLKAFLLVLDSHSNHLSAPYYAAKWMEEELRDIGGWPLAASGEDVEEPTDSEDDSGPRNWTDSYVKARADWKKNWIIGLNVVIHPKYKSKHILKVNHLELSPLPSTIIPQSHV